VLDESNLSGTITDEYVFFGAKRVAHVAMSSGSVYYYLEDFLGSSRVMTDSSGNVCYDADFDPYGAEYDVTNTCGQNYKFEGKERDAETGNDDFGARYYRSSLGRWLSADWSAIPAPVPYANLTNPQTLNLYAMVRDNPETFADLDGHILPSPEGDMTASPANPCVNGDASACDKTGDPDPNQQSTQNQSPAQSSAAQNNNVENQAVGNTTSDALAKTMTNEVGSLSTPKKGNPDVLGDAKEALANALINNANLDHPARVAPATGTASTQDAQIMKDAVANRAKGGADPVEGRTQFGTTHNPHVQWRSARNGLKGEAGRETVYEKFGPFKDSTSRRPTWIVIYNDPGQ